MGHGAWGMAALGHAPTLCGPKQKKTRLKGGGGIENGIDIGFEVSIYIYIRY
jgi:hypothetical protein